MDDTMNKNDLIAVFDSGVGGISVLRHLVRVLPEERFLYFGDSANAPYGTKSKETVKELTLAAAENLCFRGIKALVVACNTATSAAINDLRAAYPDLIVIGIEPALKLAADTFPGGKIGVMATPMTLREEKFAKLMDRFDESCDIFKIPAPGLVELIEGGRADSPETEALLSRLFENYPKLDALVLGCTHYPFAGKVLSRVLGEDVALLDGGDGTARETKRRLEAAGLLRTGEGQVMIENSANSPELLALSMQLLEEM
ncbi:MAG: glutamate racemase [Ruminococcaceae bacterium]|nr:glutamate racemase [Oscillospiraceae bacterium]